MVNNQAERTLLLSILNRYEVNSLCQMGCSNVKLVLAGYELSLAY